MLKGENVKAFPAKPKQEKESYYDYFSSMFFLMAQGDVIS